MRKKTTEQAASTPLSSHHKIALAATFAIHPIESMLIFLAKNLNSALEALFTPFNQVFQSLLNPQSAFYKQTDLNLIFLRLEDWLYETNTQAPDLQIVAEPFKKKQLLIDKKTTLLPNQLQIAQLHQYETNYLYQEIFIKKTYLKHGIHLKDNACVIDVGANIGLFTLFIKYHYPNTHVYSFEPIPEIFTVLDTNLKLYDNTKNLHAFNYGLSKINGQLQFRYYKNSTVFSGAHTDLVNDKNTIKKIIENTIKMTQSLSDKKLDYHLDELIQGRLDYEDHIIPTKTLSTVIAENQIKIINLLKIDAEGEELDILTGIDNHDWEIIEQIIVEVHGASKIEPLSALLRSKLFQVTVEQEAMLAGTNLYNIYAIRNTPRCEKSTTAEGTADITTIPQIEQASNNFIAAVRQYRSAIPTPLLTVICPPSQDIKNNAKKYAILQAMAAQIQQQLSQIEDTYFINEQGIENLYPLQEYDNPSGIKEAIPYLSNYYTALATVTIRYLNQLLQTPFKVIVLDCDNTLWDGVCSEDGPLGINIYPHHEYLQNFLLEKHQAGWLLCLCSKNNETDVLQVFNENSSMILKLHNFVAYKVNWQKKSENIKELAKELNLSLESFIFIDDNPLDCADVQHQCPEVLTLHFHSNMHDLQHYLKHLWAFDNSILTEADTSRSKFYAKEIKRKVLKSNSIDLEQFISNLNIKIEIYPATPADLPRIAQLTQRTNQFNASGIKRSSSDINHLITLSNYACLAVRVEDRFGDYGLVGAIIYTLKKKELIVDTLLLSCRALGRKIEHEMLKHIAIIAAAHHKEKITVLFSKNKKNILVHEFLKEIKDTAGKINDDLCFYSFITKNISTKLNRPNNVLGPIDKQTKKKFISPKIINSFKQKYIQRNKNLIKIATQLDSITKIEQAYYNAQAKSNDNYVAPASLLQAQLLQIWQDVFRNHHIGIEDNFYQLGGNSLLAVQITSRVTAELQTNITIHHIFDYPTISQLANEIKEHQQLISTAIPISETQETIQALSSLQHNLWLLEQITLHKSVYNLAFAFHVKIKLNINSLALAFNAISTRHTILSANFIKQDDLIVQKINVNNNFIIETNHLNQFNLKEINKIINKKLKAYNLADGALFRVQLINIGNESIIIILVHHIIFDALSMPILCRELSYFYQKYQQNLTFDIPKLKHQYGDFVKQDLQNINSPSMRSQLNYWQQKLAGAPHLLPLPTDKQRPKIQNYKGAVSRFNLSKESLLGAKELANKLGVTLFVILVTVFKLLLFRYSGCDDIVIGIPVSMRKQIAFEELIGLFVNTLPLRTIIKEITFSELVYQIKTSTLELYSHQEISFEKILQHLNPPRDMSYHPIYQVMFVLQDMSLWKPQFDGMVAQPLALKQNTAKFDLTLFVEQSDENFTLCFEYATSLFKHQSIKNMATSYECLLTSAIKNSHHNISKLELLTQKQKKQLLYSWSGQTNFQSSSDFQCLAKIIARQSLKTPLAKACSFKNEHLTYSMLHIQSNKLANYLLALGISYADKVIVCFERSIELIVAIIAIFKIGAIYIPLDIKTPKMRVQYIIQDINPRIILTHSTLPKLPSCEKIPTIFLDLASADIENSSSTTPSELTSVHDIAYIIYTSGSTGKPKAVLITHLALSNVLLAIADKINLIPSDRLLAITTFTFDISILEFFMPLTVGAEVVIAETEPVHDFYRLKNYLEASNITVMQATPSFWTLLLEAGWTNKSQLKILSGGEKLSAKLANNLLNLAKYVWNLYGPTETTIWSLIKRIKPGTLPPSIGQPIANTLCYVLDKNQQLVPPMVVGELHISGFGLSNGYLNLTEESNRKFVQLSLLPHRGHFRSETPAIDINQTCYKTGDLVRFTHDGEIEFVMRNDRQIKLNGFRIEINEIENTINKNKQVNNSLVILNNNNKLSAKLCAYIMLKTRCFSAEEEIKVIKNIKHYLSRYLPTHMLPSEFFIVDRLPLNINGKIDLSALPQTYIQPIATRFKTTNTPNELILFNIWQEVLSTSVIDKNDNFFDLGGSSILAVQVYERLKLYFKNIKVLDIFKYPTINSLANHLIRSKPSIPARMEGFSAASLSNNEPHENSFAIIGMAARLPGANNIEQFWHNLSLGKESIIHPTREQLVSQGVPLDYLSDISYRGSHGQIDKIDQFDANFFGYTTSEATNMDPQHRILLEIAWEALENAGYASDKCSGLTGVFTGMADSHYTTEILLDRNALSHREKNRLKLTNDKDFLATRIAYQLNLKGRAVNINTACSTGLVTVINACEALQSGQIDMALAGGISLILPQEAGYFYEEGYIYSEDGHCRAFDAHADGTVPASGAGMVVLKRLKDAINDGDHIEAIIKGFAINNDGNDKVGFSAPSVQGQIDCITKAYENANVRMDSISYIEAHGTATKIGDPIELSALNSAFEQQQAQQNLSVAGATRSRFIAIGSVKSNIGHTNTAAGIAGLIKTVLMLKHRKLVPSIHYKTQNPYIDSENNLFYVNSEFKEWQRNDKLLRAGISAFGIGGTNAHLILEQAPMTNERTKAQKYKALILSAKTPQALKTKKQQLQAYLLTHLPTETENIYLTNLAYTLQLGRLDFNYRFAFIFETAAEVINNLLMDSIPNFLDENNAEQELIHLHTLVNTWLAGNTVDWSKLYSNTSYKRVALPTYPFERQSYWYKPTIANVISHTNGLHEHANNTALAATQNDNDAQQFKLSTPTRVDTNFNYTSARYPNRIEIENILIGLFKTILGMQSINSTDKFFALGVDSLRVLQLVDSIKQQFAIQITPDNIYSNPDIHALSFFILKAQDKRNNHTATIVALQTQGTDNPFFLIHPGNGNLYHYQHFVKLFNNNRPIYGIENSVFNDHFNSFKSIEEYATEYIQLIKQVKANGPYLIGGWSFGGVVAFEMSQQLQANDDQVKNLILFDAWAKLPPELTNYEYFIKIFTDKLDNAPKNCDFNAWLHVLYDRLMLLSSYQPKATAVNTILFKAASLSEEYKNIAHPANHWSSYINKLQTIEVAGDHNILMDEPYIKEIAEALKVRIS